MASTTKPDNPSSFLVTYNMGEGKKKTTPESCPLTYMYKHTL